MKEEILAFLEWAEQHYAGYLLYDTGYDDPRSFNQYEINDMIDEFIKSQEEE